MIKNSFIKLKQQLNKVDYNSLIKLNDICAAKDNIRLKLELEYKLHIKEESKNCISEINEFLYYDDKDVKAYIGICNFARNTAEVTGMVHPDFRREGVFNELFKFVEDECRKRNFEKILLVCDHSSNSGLEFIKSINGSYSFSEYEMKLQKNCNKEITGKINLRKATNKDALEIMHQNSVYFGVEDNKIPEPEEEEKNNRFTYMLELNNIVIGKIRVDIENERGYICGFGILPEYRGNGYGREALNKVINILLKNGTTTNIALEVACENENALGLYKSCGFKEQSIMDYYEFVL